MQSITVRPDAASATSNAKSQQSDITLDELAKARPKRGSGAPARSRSHYAAILQLLRERAAQDLGVLGSELYARPDLYGRSPRNRISELRRDGCLIEGKPQGSSDWFYRLIRDSAAPEPPSARPAPAWQARQRVTGLPLFDLAVR